MRPDGRMTGDPRTTAAASNTPAPCPPTSVRFRPIPPPSLPCPSALPWAAVTIRDPSSTPACPHRRTITTTISTATTHRPLPQCTIIYRRPSSEPTRSGASAASRTALRSTASASRWEPSAGPRAGVSTAATGRSPRKSRGRDRRALPFPLFPSPPRGRRRSASTNTRSIRGTHTVVLRNHCRRKRSTRSTKAFRRHRVPTRTATYLSTRTARVWPPRPPPRREDRRPRQLAPGRHQPRRRHRSHPGLTTNTPPPPPSPRPSRTAPSVLGDRPRLITTPSFAFPSLRRPPSQSTTPHAGPLRLAIPATVVLGSPLAGGGLSRRRAVSASARPPWPLSQSRVPSPSRPTRAPHRPRRGASVAPALTGLG